MSRFKENNKGKKKVGIAGAGLMGRLLSLSLQRKGYHVSLFDRGPESGNGSCSYAAAGMLSPFCELEGAERIISLLGRESLSLWPTLLAEENLPVFFQREGSLVVAHPQEQADLWRLKERVLEAKGDQDQDFQEASGDFLQRLEPELDRRLLAGTGLFFPGEGQIAAREAMEGLGKRLQSLAREKRLSLHFGEDISEVLPHGICTGNGRHFFDEVIDCRGLGASPDLPTLRGVRGEIIHVKAPDVHLNRPVRLMHPRYPVYIIPRPHSHFIIGATMLETQSLEPIRVRSILELLSAAYSIHSGFGEGHVLETVVQARPAFPHHLPLILHRPGLVRVNGLFRHGFLVAPQMVQLVGEFLDRDGPLPPGPFSSLFQEETFS